MRRIYLEKEKEDNKFIKLCEKLGANYCEANAKGKYFGIWKCPIDYSVYGEEVEQLAISIQEGEEKDRFGFFSIGHINPECDNFIYGTILLDKEETIWLSETITRLKDYIVSFKEDKEKEVKKK